MQVQFQTDGTMTQVQIDTDASGTAVCVTLLAGSYAPSVDGFVV